MKDGKFPQPRQRMDALPQDRQTGLLNEAGFYRALEAELDRARRGGYRYTLAQIRIYELARVHELFGFRVDSALALAIGKLLQVWALPLEILGRGADGSFLILAPETDAEA